MTESIQTENVVETYFPLSQQYKFHKSSSRNKLYGGAVGGGKTRCLCEDVNVQMIRHAGNRGLILRKVLADFKLTTYLCLTDQVLKSAFECGMVKENKSDHYFQYRNGSRLYYGGLESSGAESLNERKKYFSGEYGVIALDEAREFSEQDFNELSTRFRHRLKNKKYPPYFMLLASNPSQNWLKSKFIRNPQPGFEFFQALPRDNKYNPPDYAAQLSTLFSGDKKFLEAYVNGSWDAIGDNDDLITMEDIERIIDRVEVKPYPLAKRITATDISRFGDDKTVIYNFVGSRIESQEVYSRKDGMATVGRLIYNVQKNKSRLLGGDSIFEASIFDRIREIQETSARPFSVHDIDFRKTSSQPNRFFNLRAEIYWEARELIKSELCKILDDDQLKGQLTSIKYKLVGGGTSGTRIKIEDKDDIRKRLGFSPDKADTFVMGLYLLKFCPSEKKEMWHDGYKQMSVLGNFQAA